MCRNSNYLTIAQASDLHICKDGLFAYKVSDTVKGLKAFIVNLNKLTVPADLLCITGDLSDDGTISSYEIIKDNLSRLKIPYYIIPGNHDNKQNMAAVFNEHTYLNNYIDNRIFHSFFIDNIKIILLDSVVDGKPFGSLTDGILISLEEELNTNHDSLVFLHQPPFPSGIGIMDYPQFQNMEKLNNILSKSKNLLLVGCGHIHRGMFIFNENINYVISPSTAMQLDLNLKDSAPAYFTLDNAGYLLHCINLSNNNSPKIITHMIHIPNEKEIRATYPFYDKI